MDLRTIGTIIFYVVLLGVAFWVGSLLEKNERNYKKFFKD
jgi:cbb3-type cytochrome oxidase subunit 3